MNALPWMAALWICAGQALAFAAPKAVTVMNQSAVTGCAEEDNVSVAFAGDRVQRFSVEALPPAYLASISVDASAPDFAGCDFDGSDHPTDPRHRFEPSTQVLHDGPQWRLVGITLPTFWRPQRVPVRIAGITTRGIHLLQLFKKTEAGTLEAIVMYPADGYWRIKPLPQARFGDGVYGSSMLIGPVVPGRRPAVAIRSIAVSLNPLAFRLQFAQGGSARVAVREISLERTALDVSMAVATRRERPFAMLRSMYVEPGNADVSEVIWRHTENGATQRVMLPALSSIDATDVRLGRSTPSRHNTSAPDLRFFDFR